jgi:hypothetical protein
MKKESPPNQGGLSGRSVNRAALDGRIIFNGFTTAKNFSDWILRFCEIVRQGEIQEQIFHRIIT